MSKVTLEGVKKSYCDGSGDLLVIDSLSYSFRAGEACAIVGRSGIGKSTLLHLVGGLDRPAHGRIMIDQTDITNLSDHELTYFRGCNIGFIFQFHHLLPEFSAVENVAMPLIIGGMSRNEALSRAKEVLERVELGHRLQAVPGRLSGGEQQRVAIARSVVTSPKVILADEPTGNLDAKTAEIVRNMLVGIQRENGTTLIVVTHSSEFASNMDYIVEMEHGGKLVEIGQNRCEVV
jgi:lipoprotein-releasing system ATP-binding protein